MTERLFAIMNRLNYGDLYELEKISKKTGALQPWKNPGSLTTHHVTLLLQEGLLWREETAAPMVDHVVNVTELGRWMLRLVREPHEHKEQGE
jgi:hypothetical protein